MIVVCYLPPQQLANIQRTFPAPHSVSNAVTWESLVSDVRRRCCDIAIVDPCTGSDHLATARLVALDRALTAPASVPLIGYVSVTASGMRAVQDLVRLGAFEIVIRGVDDSSDALATIARRGIAAFAGRRAVSAIAPRFETLPGGMARALRLAFHRPERLRSVSDLAAAARTTRRSLDRWLARAGLSSARTLLSCARANAAFHLLAGGDLRASEAASLVGYPSARSLTRELLAITGRTASAIPMRLSRDAFAAALERRLVRHSGEAIASLDCPA